jgi:carboxypeptidase T
MKSFIVLLLLACASAVPAQAHSGNHSVRVKLVDYRGGMKQIQAQSIDVAGVNLDTREVDLLVTPEQLQWLSRQGFAPVELTGKAGLAAPDSRYANPTKVESALKQFAAAYPTLARVSSIGKSLQGRDIWAIRITENAGSPDPSKPHVFFNAMHHAREVMTSEVALDIVEQLLSGYGKDPAITRWLQNYVVDVVPMFNVDGNNLVWTSDSMWRKNARGGYGVDINRNYPFAWNSCRGSSGSRWAQDFRGDSAGSEPETQVMMNFVSTIRPVFSISYHSYSEIVIYPYGCEGQRTETREVVEKVGRELASKLVRDDGRGTYRAGTAPELLYSVDGGDIDWHYAVAGVIPYVIEVNSTSQGFQPAYSTWRDKTVAGQRPGWKFLLSRMDGSSVFGQVRSASGLGVGSAVVTVRSVGGSFSQRIRVGAEGYFTAILNPGTYEVGVEAPGFSRSVRTVTVGEARVRTDLTLSKR